MNDWTTFGRVDADGTVYVKTAEGDRVVGSWQAGTPEEGLAHFARRFADLVTEVDLIEARLASGAADASHSMASIKRIRGTLDDAHVVGDIDGHAFPAQPAGDRLGQVALVLDHQHPHRDRASLTRTRPPATPAPRL